MVWPFKQSLKSRFRNCAAAGETGAAQDIYALAATPSVYKYKQPLVAGCIRAFDQGRPGNLRAFLKGYLEYKRACGDIADTHDGGIDDGLALLVASPLILLVEKSKTPSETLESALCDLSDYYRQVALDLVLRHATSAGGWLAVETALRAGADPNTAQGRPLMTAVSKNHPRIIELLVAHGASFDIIHPDASRDIVIRMATARQQFGGGGRIAADPARRSDPPANSRASLPKPPEP